MEDAYVSETDRPIEAPRFAYAIRHRGFTAALFVTGLGLRRSNEA
jgi:hypothetical protein